MGNYDAGTISVKMRVDMMSYAADMRNGVTVARDSSAQIRSAMATVEQATVAHQRAIEAVRSGMRSGGVTYDAAVAVDRTRMALSQAVANQQAAIEKAGLAEQLAAEEQTASAKEELIHREASAQAKANLQILADRRALAKETFAITHSSTETELAALSEQRMKLLMQYRSSEAMKSEISKWYAAQRIRIFQQEAVEQERTATRSARVTSEDGSGWGSLRKPIVRTAGQITQGLAMSGVGGDIGYFAMMAASLGAVGAAAASAGLAISLMLESARRNSQWVAEMNKGRTEYATNLSKSVANLSPTTQAGDRYRQAAELARSRRDDLAKAEQAEQPKSRWDRLMNSFDPNRTTRQQQLMMDKGNASDDVAKYDELAAAEEKRAAARARSAQLADIESAKIQAMADGPAKELAQLTAQQADERRRAVEANEDHPGSVDMGLMDEKHMQQRIALNAQQSRRENETIQSDLNRAAELRVQATTDESTRELAILKLKHQQELREYQNQGRAIWALQQRQAAEEQALLAQRAERVTNSIRDLQNQIDLLTGAKNQRDITLFDLGKLTQDKDQLQQIGDLIDRINAARKFQERTRDQAAAIEGLVGQGRSMLSEAERVQFDRDQLRQRIGNDTYAKYQNVIESVIAERPEKPDVGKFMSTGDYLKDMQSNLLKKEDDTPKLTLAQLERLVALLGDLKQDLNDGINLRGG